MTNDNHAQAETLRTLADCLFNWQLDVKPDDVEYLGQELRIGLAGTGQSYMAGVDLLTLIRHTAWNFEHFHRPLNHLTIMNLAGQFLSYKNENGSR